MAEGAFRHDSDSPHLSSRTGEQLRLDDWRVVLAISAVAILVWFYSFSWPPLVVVAITAFAVSLVARAAMTGDETWSRRIDNCLSHLEKHDRQGRLPAIQVVVGVLVGISVSAFLARWIPAFEYVRDVSFYVMLALGTAIFAVGMHPVGETVRRIFMRLSLCCLVASAAAWIVSSSVAVATHPVFQTPVSLNSSNRPAVQVDVTDDTEFGGWGTAELYLSVQSSRFPQHVHVILPINRNSFVGCKSRFLQLPFEVERGDVLAFNLLDDNTLSAEQEQVLLSACESAGFCIEVGSTIYRPNLAALVRPISSSASRTLGNGAVLIIRDSPFRNFGTGEFIVESVRPSAPNLANRTALLDEGQRSRASVRVYFPHGDLNAGVK